MGQQVRGFPRFPKHGQTVTFGDRRYKVIFTWRQRAASWYFDLFTADGTAIALGRRMSAGFAPIANVGFDVDVAPDGNLFVRGSDGYLREDLGKTLILVRYANDELPATATASDLVIV